MSVELNSRVSAALKEIAGPMNLEGDDLELLDVSDGIARIRFGAACASCPSTLWPLIVGLEHELRSRIPEIELVEAVS